MMKTKLHWCSVLIAFLCSIMELSMENIEKKLGHNSFENLISKLDSTKDASNVLTSVSYWH